MNAEQTRCSEPGDNAAVAIESQWRRVTDLERSAGTP
jgi:hypothetical protein